MAEFVKVGDKFINMDQVCDVFPSIEFAGCVVVGYGDADSEFTLNEKESAMLVMWLNGHSDCPRAPRASNE